MKKNVFVGMLAMALVFGLIFTACPMDGNDDDGNDDLSGIIFISSTSGGPVVTMARPVGQPLYAVYAGSEAVTYQWKQDGGNLSGATGPSYTPNEAGVYSVTVSRAGYNSKTSASVTVSIGVAGSLYISGADGGAAIDRALASETLYAVYGGTGTPAYQWKKDGTNLSGATGPSYYIPPEATGEYAVTVSVPGFTSITSASVTVTANSGNPVLSGSMVISTTSGGAAVTTATTEDTLYAVYGGSETVTYQWKKDGTNVSTGSSYKPTATGSYTVTVSATDFPSKTSASVTVSSPVLTGSMVISTTSGGAAVTTATTKDTLYAVYTGEETGDPAYQWKRDGTNVTSGGTGSSYTPTTTGSYTVTVTVSGKSRTSDPVEVRQPVLSGAIVISDTSGGSAVTTATIGQTLYAVYSGGEPGSPEYRWNKDGNLDSAGSSLSYKPSVAGSYTVTVMAPGYQSKTSDPVTVTGGEEPANSITSWTRIEDEEGDIFPIDFQGIVWGGGKFVAVGYETTGTIFNSVDTGKIAYSSDGVNWTRATLNPFASDHSYIRGVAWGGAAGNEKFVAVGSNNTITSSPDGVNWTNGDFTGHLYGIAWGGTAGNEKFVAVGFNGIITSSPDGANWTPVSNSAFTGDIHSIAWGGGKWVAAGNDGKMAYSTDNGETWTQVSPSPFGSSDRIYAAAWGNGKWVAAGSVTTGLRGGTIAYSSDGITWTKVNSHPFFASSSSIQSIAWGNDKWIAAGTSGTLGGQMAYSSNGETWTEATGMPLDPNFSIAGIVYGGAAGNKRFVAAGGGIFLGNPGRIWYSNVLNE
jgi:hypothetical protein